MVNGILQFLKCPVVCSSSADQHSDFDQDWEREKTHREVRGAIVVRQANPYVGVFVLLIAIAHACGVARLSGRLRFDFRQKAVYAGRSGTTSDYVSICARSVVYNGRVFK